MNKTLTDAIARYDEFMSHLVGCTDGGCVIRRPVGMHTNGGCRCPRDYTKMQRAMYAANELRKALGEVLVAQQPEPRAEVKPRKVERHSDMSVLIAFCSTREASVFEKEIRARAGEGQ